MAGDREEPHNIRLPESILDQIDDKKYENDERFAVPNTKKRKEKSITRKEKRTQERQLKKQKKSKQAENNSKQKKNGGTTSVPNSKNLKSILKTGKSDPLAELAASKAKKNKTNGVRVVKAEDLEEDDDLSDMNEDEDDEDPLAKLMALKKNKKSGSDIRIVREDDLDEDEDELEFDLDEADEEEDETDDPMAKLMALKKNKKSKPSEIRIVKEDDLDDDEDLEFDLDEENEDEDETEDPLAKLKALKENKKSKPSEIRVVKQDELSDDDFDVDSNEELDNDDFEGFEDEESEPEIPSKPKKTKKSKEPTKSKRILSLHEQELLKRDEDDIAYYAKKLGLKSGSKSKLSKTDEFDEIGGLLDGLDFDLDNESGLESDEAEIEEPKKEKKEKKKKTDKNDKKSEPRIISNHDQELLDRDQQEIEFYAKKLGLKNGAKSKLSKIDDDDEIGGLLDGLDLEFSDGDDVDEEENDGESEVSDFDDDSELGDESEEEEVKVKENPFVAPVADSSEGKYIPPALRRKMALENNEVSAEVLQLRKEIKGPLNKLSEANIATIVNDINGLFLKNPRQVVNEELTSIVLDSIVQQGRLLDTFVYLHATLIVAIHRLQGFEFGAYFIQTLVEKFEIAYKDESDSKKATNIISLLSSVYLFQLISSKLIYDIVKNFVKDLNEKNADLLLRLIRSSGNQMRTDDPNALKDIVLEINASLANIPLSEINTRTQFLIETISSLKNNKLKISNEANHQLSIRLKKFLGGINNNKFNDPIQVSLADIRDVETRGKWWLVGSAWKGHGAEQQGSDVNEIAMNDILDQADPNWMELARSQRMNTDIRRAIFVSIMSAQDYIDAVTKLDKLALKRSQEREIPRVLVQCAGVEPAWNPYYGILAKKLCDQHSYRKTFQFMLWDLIKEFEGTNDEEDDFLGFDTSDINGDQLLKRTLNLGRFYGFLISEGCLPIHILKTVNFLTANNDTVLFIEVLFVTLLDKIGKKSQVRHVGLSHGSKELKFEDKLLIELIMKAKDQTTLLRGIQYFLLEKIRSSSIIDGNKQRKRVEWGIDAFTDIIDELLKDERD